MKEVFIVSAARTPIGSFGGSLADISAVTLGATVTRNVLDRISINPELVDELFFGNVISTGLGQAPATQVAVHAGLGYKIPATLVNKVCASGMKAVMFGAQSIQLGQNNIVLAGGMENMSAIPYFLTKARFGYKFGAGEIKDALTADALTDVYNQCAMGVCADHTAKELNISRKAQDEFAIQSYQRSARAWSAGKFKDEICPIEIPSKKGSTIIVSEDESYKDVNFEKIPGLKPAFSKEGTVTAANASTLNDGAAALLLMSAEAVKSAGVKPIARIMGYADASQDPMWFTTTPAIAIPKAIKQAGLTDNQIDYYEINEAFSAVALTNMQLLNLNPERVNVNGGAVALGHPLGASGARILVTLLNVLQQNNAKIGVAGICNGGGGASAMVVELC
jgi:acetyl-CoA C-acetyltransferase